MRTTMRMIRNHKIIKPVALVLCFTLVSQLVAPLSAYALTSGPSQPEFSSFEPVGTVQMVNDFSGALTYNLPLLEVPGPEGSSYPLSLSYHSGASAEEDASWVGFGWTLNPGAIQRNKSGYPDDYKKAEVVDYNRVPANWTVNLGSNVGFEVFSMDLPLQLAHSVRYNNYQGFGRTMSAGMVIQGLGTLGYSYTDGDGAFSFQINVSKNLDKDYKLTEKKIEHMIRDGHDLTDREIQRLSTRHKGLSNWGMGFSVPVNSSHATTLTPYVGGALNFTAAFEANAFPLPAGVTAGLEGGFALQRNIAENKNDAYGYLYSHASGEKDVMDYTVERNQSYEKRDHYLSIPYSSPDQWSVTGAGVGGSFRARSKDVGHFHPNKVTSFTTIGQGQLEIGAGMTVSLGSDVGLGLHTLTTGEWSNDNYTFTGAGDEPYYFKFDNDLGGTMSAGGLGAIAATPNKILDRAEVPTALPKQHNQGNRVGRSSYIGFNTNAEMLGSLGGNSMKAYTRVDDLINGTNLGRGSNPSGIGEFSVVNPGGARYNYSLPVRSRNEHELNYLLRQRVNGHQVENNHMAYGEYTVDDAPFVVGRKSATPYASQYLLTEILQPDYLDRTLDGPTADDFGGWTRFHYAKHHGEGEASWYKWRMPYTGLSYSRNELSDPMDDMGAVRYGEKEIYLLEKVETRSHIAIFHTSPRDDGYDAAANEADAAEDKYAKGNGRLEKLDKIELWRKDASGQPGELLKTVHFQYDYSSWACGTLLNGAANKGKLTLRRVWFDYQGTVNARISPYEFYYQYPRTTNNSTPSCNPTATNGLTHRVQVDYPSRYDGMEDYGQGKNETPAYHPTQVDAWGSYAADGMLRHDELMNWVDQTPTASFDPAAYQLKVVRFPSGGQIHIHYEQNDYNWVQDRLAHALVGVEEVPGQPDEYYLKTDTDFGLPLGGAAQTEIFDYLRREYKDKGKKLYFKFLYSLFPTSAPALTNCDVEWVEGYVTLKDVHMPTNSRIKVTVGNAGVNPYTTPRDLCNDLLRTTKAGKVRAGMNCDASGDAMSLTSSPVSMINQLAAWMVNGTVALCGAMDYDHSYFRVPLPNKKGGGIRVKRVLMYDEGIEPGGEDRVLYGTEYEYKMADGHSSGVISREPGSVSCEDPLYQPLDRDPQGRVDRIIAGKDREENEGPIGEQFIGQSGVGYRRVLSKSIHSGITSPGYKVNEYYTYWDFPYDMDYGNGLKGESHTQIQRKRAYVPAIAGLLPISYGKDNRFVTQGYSFVQYDIHGQPKRTTAYAGSYSTQGAGGPITAGTAGMIAVSSQEYEYWKPGESLPMMNDLDYNGNNGWYPGREVEVVTESRKVVDINVNGRVEVDANLCLFALLVVPLPTWMPNINYQEHKLKQHVTTRIERYPAIVKRVRSMQDGIVKVTENVAYNPETGDPVLTRSYDGFHKLPNLDLNGPGSLHDGSYHSYVIPGSREYPALKGMYGLERLSLPEAGAQYVLDKVTVAGERFLVFDNQNGPPSDACAVLGGLCEGSRVLVKGSNGTEDGVYTLGAANGNSVPLLASAFFPHDLLNANVQTVTVTVLQSGCKNRLSEAVGSFTTYGPIQTITTVPPVASVNTDRENLYATPLNNLLAGLGNGGSATFYSTQCVFENAYSNDIGIRLTTSFSGGNSYLEIELLDFAHAAGIVRCSEVVPNFSGGSFAISGTTGELVFLPDGLSCRPYKLPCLSFCEQNGMHRTIPKVVVAESQTLAQHWPYPVAQYGAPYTGSNVYESGEMGQWRGLSGYKYRDEIRPGAQDGPYPTPPMSGPERIYDAAGTFTLEIFNHQDPSLNDRLKWLGLSTVTNYSPYGVATEEKDILGVYSNAHYGYRQMVPTMVAKNSSYSQCYFESFEVDYDANQGNGTSLLEEGVVVTQANRQTTISHAGNWSYKLTGPLALRPFQVDAGTMENGLSVLAWVHDTKYSTDALVGTVGTTAVTMPLDFKWVARTGEWSLYEARVVPGTAWGQPNVYITAGDLVTITLNRNPNLNSNTVVWIDDIRFQPLDAQASCHVYDANLLRPVCTFDDQHFGVYNQYDAEGKLVRKRIETERGIRTVQESHIHTPTQLRQ